MRNFEDLVDWVDKGRPFSFVRYGDGEWNSILGIGRGANVDGQRYSPELAIALQDSLTLNLPDHFFALNPIARLCGRDNIDNYLSRRGLVIDWLNGDMMLEASLDGRLNPLVKALRKRPLLYVGPAYLEPFIAKQFPNSGYIVVPVKNSFDCRSTTLIEIAREAQNFSIVAFSNGMATNILVTVLRRLKTGCTLLDMGSLWEGYVSGGAKRTHAKKLTQKAIGRNLA